MKSKLFYEYRDGKHGVFDGVSWRDTFFGSARRAQMWIDKINRENGF
jgi:hypothetical protein